MAGVIDGLAPSNKAAAPTTCGVAIEVPLSDANALVLVYHADTMADPGAKTSTQLP